MEKYECLKPHLGKSFSDSLQDPNVPLSIILEFSPNLDDVSDSALEDAELEIRYKHYVELQDKRLERLQKMENTVIPANFDYDKISGLSTESKARLKTVMPETIGQASRIPGIRPSDIMLLTIAIK